MELDSTNKEIVDLLKDIRNLLVPISASYLPQYEEMQRKQIEAVKLEFLSLLNPVRETIFTLLFDPKRLSQIEIAKAANTTQPTVSRFIAQLLEKEIIEQVIDNTGSAVYKDKYNLIASIKKNRKIGGEQ